MAFCATSTALCSCLLSTASVFKTSSDSIVSLGYVAREIVDRHRTWDFILLVSSSFVVFLGIAFEWWEIKHECGNAWKMFRNIKFIDSPIPPLATIFGAIGWVLILVGVFGECWYEVKLNRDDNNIGYINGVILEKTGESAKDAEISANRASLFSSEAENSAIRSDADATDAQKKVAAVEKQADALDGRIRQAKAFADFALARTRPRAFGMDAKKFVDKLRGVAPCNVEIRYKPEDTEAYDLAEKIAQALGKGFDGTGKDGLGWNVTGPLPLTDKPRVWLNETHDTPPSNFFAAGFSFGGGFAVGDPAAVGDPNGGATVWKLSAAMDAAGIHFMWITQDVHLPPDTIRVIVLSQFD